MARSERGLLVIAVAVAAALAACNAITGLDSFDEVDCVGACGDAAIDAPGAVPPEASPPDGDETGVTAGGEAEGGASDAGDAEAAAPIEAGPAIDRTWARWIMPNTADAAIHPTAFDVGPASIRDQVTELVWDVRYQHAISAADASTKCVAPWRVPTKIELVSILDTSRAPAVSPLWSAPPTGSFWTSSVTNGTSWTVDLTTGDVHLTTFGEYVLCVQGGP